MPNYRTNEDRRCNDTGGPNYNLIHSVDDISDESGPVSEPVTLTEMKNYLRLFGFDDSGEFDFDDDLIETMITGARERLEVYTGQHFIPKTLRVYYTNGLGLIDLPGPVMGDITITDYTGEIELVGAKFPSIKTPTGESQVATYNAGYETLPKGLKLSIMMQVAYDYEHRGDEQDEVLCKKAMVQVRPYIKGSAWA